MGLITKAFVTVILVGLIVFGFWALSWQGIQTKVTHLKTEIAGKKQEYNKLTQESQNIAKWQKDVGEWNKVLQELHQVKPIKNFIPSFLISIEKLAKYERITTGDSTLRIKSITPGQVVIQGAATGKTKTQTPGLVSGKSSVSITFTGRFNTVVNFLQQLGNFKLNKLVTIQSISLTPQSAKPGSHPTLSVTMPFEMYMLGG